MIYKLIDTGQGLLENREPIFYDTEGNIELSFLLPTITLPNSTQPSKLQHCGRYFGLFTNMTGTRRQLKVEFKGNILTIPQDFKLPGIYLLTVIQIDDKGNILKSWDCEPFRIRSLDKDLRTEFEVTGAASEDDMRQWLFETQEELIRTRRALEGCISKKDLEDYKELVENQLTEIIEKFNTFSDEVEKIRGGF